MVTSATYFARGANYNSSNADLNVRSLSQVRVTSLTFLETDGGALSFTYNGGLPDPDTFVFVNGSTEPLTFTVDYTGTIPNELKFSSVNGVDLRGAEIVTVTLSTGQKFFFFTDPTISSATLSAFPNGAVAITNMVTAGPPMFLCFVAGTLIDTPLGPVAVDALREGQLVTCLDGPPAPVRLAIRRRVTAAEIAARPAIAPIRIPAHALGRGTPARDLFLSPQHRIWLQGWQVELMFGQPAVLIPAKHLRMGGIGPVPAPQGVDYVHLLFDRHEVVMAEGLPCESWQPAAAALDVLTDAERDRFLSVFTEAERHHFLTRPDAAPSLKAGEGLALSGMWTARAA